MAMEMARSGFSEVVFSSTGEVVEVISGMKQTSLIVKFNVSGEEFYALYRPEDGIRVSICPEIPKPEELYRDCAFSEICNSVGWNFVLPVIPWRLDEESVGVLRPFLKSAGSMNVYDFRKDQLLRKDANFWKKIAVMDYIFGVGDRVSNDFLVTDSGIKVIDSGISFLPGLDISLLSSIVRSALVGEKLGDEIKPGQLLLIKEAVYGNQFLADENKNWVYKRIEKVLREGVVI